MPDASAGDISHCEVRFEAEVSVLAESTVVLEPAVERPGLVFFFSRSSGRCRRVESYLAQVLQRRGNHETFRLYRVSQEQRPDLVDRFRVCDLPTLLVVERKLVRGRLASPATCAEIESFLAPWLR